MTPGRIPPEPDDYAPRHVAEGAARALEQAVPTDGNGLGSVGEELVERGFRAWKEGDPEVNIAFFSRPWLGLVKRGNHDPQLVAGIEAAGRAQIRKFARRAALKSSWKWAVGAGGLVYAAIQYSTEAAKWIIDHVPLLRSILKLLLEGGV